MATATGPLPASRRCNSAGHCRACWLGSASATAAQAAVFTSAAFHVRRYRRWRRGWRRCWRQPRLTTLPASLTGPGGLATLPNPQRGASGPSRPGGIHQAEISGVARGPSNRQVLLPCPGCPGHAPIRTWLAAGRRCCRRAICGCRRCGGAGVSFDCSCGGFCTHCAARYGQAATGGARSTQSKELPGRAGASG